MRESAHSHPASGLDSLVDKVRIGFSGDEAAWPLGHIEVPVLQNDPALTDDHHRETPALHSLKDVHLHGLRRHTGQNKVWHFTEFTNCRTLELFPLETNSSNNIVNGLSISPQWKIHSHTRLWDLAEKIFVSFVFQITMSASDPTAIRPFRGYRLKIFAAFVLVTATKSFSSILPVAYVTKT